MSDSLYFRLNADRSISPVENWSEVGEIPIRVALTRIDYPGVDAYVSTVFLGLNMAPFLGVKPIVFETMAFIDGQITASARYTTYALAEAGHRLVVGGIEEEVAQRVAVAALDAILPPQVGTVVRVPGMRSKRGPRKML